MGIKTVLHRPYSPELAPCDFWLFPKLRGCSYEIIEEMKEALTKVIDTLTQEDFHWAFQKLLQRLFQLVWLDSWLTTGKHSNHYAYIYIYIEREREKGGDWFDCMKYIYIYIYIPIPPSWMRHDFNFKRSLIGLNSEFSLFLRPAASPKLKTPVCPNIYPLLKGE